METDILKERPKTPNRPKRWLLLSLVVVLILLILAALLYLGYVLPAKRAVKAYGQRLSHSKTLSFQTTAKFTGSDFLSALNTDINSSGHLNRANGLTATALFAGVWMGKHYLGESDIDQGRLFAKLTGPSLPVIRYKQSSFLVPMQPEWYSAKLDGSIFDNICENRLQSSNQDKLNLYRNFKQFKVKSSWWVNFWSHYAGHRATHLSGTVPNVQLPQLLTSLQKALPPGCGLNTLGFSPSDSSKWDVHYDLYLQSQHDTIKLAITDKTLGAHTAITLNTFDYNKPATIPTPPPAIDLNQIYSQVQLAPITN